MVLFPGREIGQLAGDHDFHCHHGQLAGDAGEVDQRLAELLAVDGVLHAHVQRSLGHADGARGGLDAGRFEGFHQLLEAVAFLAPKQVLALDLEVVEAKLVLLHAAIPQHLDLSAGHALGGEGILIRAGGFLGQEHRQALVVVRRRIGACQQGHHMRPRGMGDPGLVAGDAVVAVLVFDGAGPQRPQV